MPSKNLHLKFDEYLKDKGVIYEDTNGMRVHERMDRDLQKYGHWNHRYSDYYHNDAGIREWIRKWSHLAYQETMTDYIRICFGHLVLDEMEYRYPDKSNDELIKSSYRSFIQRGFHRKRFKS